MQKTFTEHAMERNIQQAVIDLQAIGIEDVGKSFCGEVISAVFIKPNGDKLVLYEGRDVGYQGLAVGVWMRDE